MYQGHKLILFCYVSGNFFIRYSEHGTPFDSGLDETFVEEDIMANIGDEASGYFSDESDDEPDELKRDYVEEYPDENENGSKPLTKEKREKHHSKSPILTNTTLSVLRQMGRYLQMSRLLRSVSHDIIMCMTQFFDFYLYTVHHFFTSDLVSIRAFLYIFII